MQVLGIGAEVVPPPLGALPMYRVDHGKLRCQAAPEKDRCATSRIERTCADICMKQPCKRWLEDAIGRVVAELGNAKRKTRGGVDGCRVASPCRRYERANQADQTRQRGGGNRLYLGEDGALVGPPWDDGSHAQKYLPTSPPCFPPVSARLCGRERHQSGIEGDSIPAAE